MKSLLQHALHSTFGYLNVMWSFYYRYDSRPTVSSWDSTFSQRPGKRLTEQELYAVSEKLSQRLSELDWASLVFYIYIETAIVGEYLSDLSIKDKS